MAKLELEFLNVDAVKTNARNARTHTKKQVRQIAASIERFGFTNPVLVDEANVLIAGHGRLEAAIKLGLAQVPSIRIAHLNAIEKRALMRMRCAAPTFHIDF